MRHCCQHHTIKRNVCKVGFLSKQLKGLKMSERLNHSIHRMRLFFFCYRHPLIRHHSYVICHIANVCWVLLFECNVGGTSMQVFSWPRTQIAYSEIKVEIKVTGSSIENCGMHAKRYPYRVSLGYFVACLCVLSIRNFQCYFIVDNIWFGLCYAIDFNLDSKRIQINKAIHTYS